MIDVPYSADEEHSLIHSASALGDTLRALAV
jgi:hypothetical protein